MKDQKSKKNDFKKPLAISVGLHVALVAALLWGTDFTMSKPETSGHMVEAVVIDPNLVKQQAQQIRSQREAAAKQEQERLDKLRRESEQLEKNRKEEEERIRQLKEQQAKEAKAAREAEKVRQQKEQEQKVAAEKARQEQERAAKAEAERKLKEEAAKKAEAERVAKEAAAAKAEQERVAREKAAQEAQEKARKEREAAAKAAAEKARLEKERAERAERERKEQEAALNNIFAGLETESQNNSVARSQHVTSEAQRWGAIYTQLIQQNLLLEDSFKGKQCKVNLRLIPTGTGAIVGDLRILDGDSRLCAATKRAVAQVGTFPLPKKDESDVIEKLKNINLTVVPE
ncbi:cell envelope integrity protein TolA [Vibrio fluvialis]|uniref:cell envelope integrity protein TolA n=1 Tax=Vibrio fluvialis TaxID=676 RepID=UPI00192AC077|nr:cell envelope integrity protein TolA [Vibrio fluvialis]MBL4240472.1 cell envelope integrity protein TolA [Vibrio fluvialis]MBL4265525.1 cell envelope integrity protein TolA [Vibrio fluvialis]MBL4271764.1 cell envelope integrity protein TolA [Vibrio fluvialis]MBL4276109.1 cell envelope integrity protein TolA [Vibrio fluvialis]MBO1442046.1 cell envelope integrity protein TolA [Vibrio fluvialis]